MSGRWRTRSEGRLTGDSAAAGTPKIELGQPRLVRKLADQDCKLIAGLREGLLERRQVRARLRALRALREHVRTREGAERKLLLDQLQLAFLRIDDIARRADLLAQRRFAERGGRDVPVSER